MARPNWKVILARTLGPGVRDTEFCQELDRFLGCLRGEGRIRAHRITRRKPGFGPPSLGEFQVEIEVADLPQLDAALRRVAAREGEIESLHAAVNSKAHNATSALYRDFPDDFRARGEEKL